MSMIADGLFRPFPDGADFRLPQLAGPGSRRGRGARRAGDGRRRSHLLTITGHSGHAALPHLTRDPMVASAHLLLACRRSFRAVWIRGHAVVITIGTIQAGTAADRDPRPRGDARHDARLARRERRSGGEAIRRIAAAWRAASTSRSTCRSAPGHSGHGECAGGTRSGGEATTRRGRDAASRPGAGDDRRGFRLVSCQARPAPSSGSATDAETAVRCTILATTSTMRSCRRHRASWPVWRSARSGRRKWARSAPTLEFARPRYPRQDLGPAEPCDAFVNPRGYRAVALGRSRYVVGAAILRIVEPAAGPLSGPRPPQVPHDHAFAHLGRAHRGITQPYDPAA